MAATKSTTKRTTSTTKKESEGIVEDFEKLKKENDELKSTLNTILGKLSDLEKNEKKVSSTDSSNENTDNSSNEYIDINPMKPIKLISLTYGGLNLRTEPKGTGRNIRFTKFGQSRFVPYQDLQNILTVDRSFIEQGYVYICDEDVVKNNYLIDDYKSFLSKDTIENILTFPLNDIVSMVSNTTEAIQETIVDLIVNKINKNEYVDMNKVSTIGQVCKKPCDIMQLAIKRR